MISKNRLIYIVYIVIIVIIVGIVTNISINFFPKKEERAMFPGILGDTILLSNETGIDSIRSIVSYDDFRGNIIQGYKANYTGRNGTMIIFMAQMPSNESAYRSLKEMVARIGYNQSLYNESRNDTNKNVTDDNVTGDNVTIVRLPIDNPELFLIQKDKNKIWHYTFSKQDKVYWIGFNNLDVQYHIDMMLEVYRNVDKKLDDEYINE